VIFVAKTTSDPPAGYSALLQQLIKEYESRYGALSE